ITKKPSERISVCQTCGECCKRYPISILPHERSAQARFMGVSEEEFTRTHTRLLVQLVPFPSSDHPLAIATAMLPKTLVQILESNGLDSPYVMILPMVGLRKEEYCIFFDADTFGCTTHPVKPAQCRLFPFTSLKENEDYATLYDFCGLATISSPTQHTFDHQRAQKERMHAYFDAVAKEGLGGVWGTLPLKGNILFRGKEVSTIRMDELNEWLSLSRSKTPHFDNHRK
ncbi:MAG: YkgJ family cysteine cluster protein, partial [archaeon]|nr:YkgJ family cysteine cluster protein [archaeon]